MDKSDVLKKLALHFILRSDEYLDSAVVLRTFKDVKQFSRDFYDLLDSVPDWLLPPNQKKVYTFKYQFGSIVFVNTTEKLRGIRIRNLYYSDAIEVKTKKELEDYIYPTMLWNSNFIEFKDRFITYKDRNHE